MRDEKISRQLNGQCRRAPRECYATASVSVIMDQQFATQALGIDDKTSGTIGSQAYHLTNHSIARDFYWGEISG